MLHTESGSSPAIAEGTAEWYTPSEDESGRLAVASQAKYGFATPAESCSAGVWRLRPGVVWPWNLLYRDATRFTAG